MKRKAKFTTGSTMRHVAVMTTTGMIGLTFMFLIDAITLFWVSKLENENFMAGTMFIADAISKNTRDKSLISILGGGDTLAAINKSKNKLSFTHLSTAGGAFLEYLEGKDLPGLSVLK